jgi:hypothetical protein
MWKYVRLVVYNTGAASGSRPRELQQRHLANATCRNRSVGAAAMRAVTYRAHVTVLRVHAGCHMN